MKCVRVCSSVCAEVNVCSVTCVGLSTWCLFYSTLFQWSDVYAFQTIKVTFFCKQWLMAASSSFQIWRRGRYSKPIKSKEASLQSTQCLSPWTTVKVQSMEGARDTIGCIVAVCEIQLQQQSVDTRCQMLHVSS